MLRRSLGEVCDPDIMVNGDFEIKGTTTLPTDIPGWVGRGWSLGTPAQSGEWARSNALRVIEFQIASGGPSNTIDHVTLTANLGLMAVDASGIHEAQLGSNIPNPFGLTTVIKFELPRAGRADLELFDLNGRLVKRLVGAHLDAGMHTTTWEGPDQAPVPPPGVLLPIVGGVGVRFRA